MKFFQRMKDGGPESPVIGYFLVEIKSLFSIVLLHFTGTREAFHSHAFNAVTLWIRGKVTEVIRQDSGVCGCGEAIDGHPIYDNHAPVDIPYTLGKAWAAGQFKYTARGTMHQVQTSGAWAISFRGPWAKTWQEIRPTEGNRLVTLTHGRKEIA